MGNTHMNSGYLSATLVNNPEGGNIFSYSAQYGESSRLSDGGYRYVHGRILGHEIAVEQISQNEALTVCNAMDSCGGVSFSTGAPTLGYGHRFLENPHDGVEVHFYDSNQTGTLNYGGQPGYHEGWVSFCKWDF
mmetsp:Transcript_1302/g.3648  ORF Transcript_1302/g.3648 Transcript_1302/m.3648 type:complete len:134 (+) Transcript_1302:130-531(+)